MDFDPQNQTLLLTASDGMTEIPLWLPDMDAVINEAISISINYAAQIGACFTMLLVVLTMTARSRFVRATTLINLAALAVGTIRCTLLVLYFTSSYLKVYTFFAHDYAFVDARDTRISIAATVFGIPQLVLIEAALIIQAWSMVQLWRPVWRWPTIALSALIAFFAIGFKCASAALQIHAILGDVDTSPYVWVRQTDLAFGTTTISWFTFVFMLRIVLHMVEHRSILPSIKGLSAMDVLVMTNGVLMLVPLLFAGLQFGEFASFESGSLTYTSVVVILPLGTLVAQRLAATGSLRSPAGTNHTSGTGSESKKRFLGNWSHHSNGPASPTMSRGAPVREKVDPVDLELQRIDNESGSGVWVGTEVRVTSESRS